MKTPLIPARTSARHAVVDHGHHAVAVRTKNIDNRAAACAHSFGDNFITGNVIGNMCRDGRFGRDGDRIFLLDEGAERS
jgi:hypothetical protein